MKIARYKISNLEAEAPAEPVGIPVDEPAVEAGAPPTAGVQPPLPQPTASEGTHPLAVSPEEGLFAVPQEKVISALQKLLKLKYTAIISWMNYGDRLRSHYRDTIYAHFNEHMQEERQDAYHLAMKITALGGEPTPKVSSVADVNDLHQMLIVLLQLEKELLQATRELSLLAGDNMGLKVSLDEIALKDSRHADDLRRMMFCEGS